MGNDLKAAEVSVRINGNLSGSHSTNSQYLEDCYKKLTSRYNVSVTACASVKLKVVNPADCAFEAIVGTILGRSQQGVELH